MCQEVLVDVRNNLKGNVLPVAFSLLLLHVYLTVYTPFSSCLWIESVQEKK